MAMGVARRAMVDEDRGLPLGSPLCRHVVHPAIPSGFSPQVVILHPIRDSRAWLCRNRFSDQVWRGAILSETTKVLLAEDEPSLCRYLVTLLDQMNCEIAVEHDGEDAIRRAATFQPDVALVGFVMPGIDGSATGIGLLKVSPHTKVVFIVEPVLPETLESLRAQGYDFETLPAPFERAQLEALLETSSWK